MSNSKGSVDHLPIDRVPPDPVAPSQADTAAPDTIPFVCVDLISAYGFCDGSASLTVKALRFVNTPCGGVRRELVHTGVLRMGLEALAQVRAVVDDVERMVREAKAKPLN